jgi:hypothetical protein
MRQPGKIPRKFLQTFFKFPKKLFHKLFTRRLFPAVNKPAGRLFTAFPHRKPMKMRGLGTYSHYRLIHRVLVHKLLTGRNIFGPPLA